MPWQVPTEMITGLGSAAETESSAYATAAQGAKADAAVPGSGGTLTGGFIANARDDGTIWNGTYTPDPTNGNFRTVINRGAFTIAAPTGGGSYTIVLHVQNGAGAGAISFSGFYKVDGADDLTTVNGQNFFVFITKLNWLKHAQVVPLQ